METKQVKKIHEIGAAFIAHDGKVLLGHHMKVNKWVPPGGHVDPGETPCETAVREAKEESGLDIELEHPYGEGATADNRLLPPPVYVEHHSGDFKGNDPHFHFSCVYKGKLKDPTQKVNYKKDEMHDMRWFTPEEIAKGEFRGVPISNNIKINAPRLLALDKKKDIKKEAFVKGLADGLWF